MGKKNRIMNMTKCCGFQGAGQSCNLKWPQSLTLTWWDNNLDIQWWKKDVSLEKSFSMFMVCGASAESCCMLNRTPQGNMQVRAEQLQQVGCEHADRATAPQIIAQVDLCLLQKSWLPRWSAEKCSATGLLKRFLKNLLHTVNCWRWKKSKNIYIYSGGCVIVSSKTAATISAACMCVYNSVVCIHSYILTLFKQIIITLRELTPTILFP